MSQWKQKQLPLSQVQFSEAAGELMDTPLMEPYIQFHMSISKPNADVSACLAQIAKIPLHDRYVWRIASALQWGFADYDSGSVRVDRDTLTPEEREKVSRLLTDRPGQFCRFLSAWFGADKMAQLMIEAIADAKQRG